MDNQKMQEVLIRVRAMIADPNHWTKNTSARDERGNPVPSLIGGGHGIRKVNPRATCFCFLGAMTAVACEMEIDQDSDDYDQLLTFAQRQTSHGLIAKENDEGDHENIIAFCDKVIIEAVRRT